MMIPFFLLTALCIFIFFFHFPLISQAELHPSPQSKSNTLSSDSNSLKTFSSPSQPEASSLFVKALLAMEKKDLKTASQNFERLIFYHPQNQITSLCCFYLGEIYQKEGLEQEAQAIYGQFIQQYPDHRLFPEVLSRQGEIHFQLGEIKRAQKIFKQLVLQYPKTNLAVNASFRLGDCLYELDDPYTARLYYDEGMKKLPEYINLHPQTALNIGYLYLEDQHFDQALEVFSNIAKNFPHGKFANKAETFCGDIYMEQGKIQDALQTYQSVIDNYPDSIGAQISKIRMANFGVEYQEEGIKDPNNVFQAFYHPITTYKKLIQAKNTDPDVAYLAEYELGVALQKKEKYVEAIDVFRSMLTKSPGERIYQNSLHSLKDALINYLTHCFHKNEYFTVIEIYEKNKYLLDFFFHKSKNPTTYFDVAFSYQNLGFYLQALELYQKSKEITASLRRGSKICDQIQLHLGQIFFQTEEYQKALNAIQKIRGGSDPSITFNSIILKGDIYYEQKNLQKAIEAYLAAFKIQSSLPKTEYLFKISQCYQNLGAISEAVKFLNKAADSAHKEKNTLQLVNIYLDLAFHHYNAKNYSEALKIYRKLQTMPLSPNDKDWILFQIGNCSQREVKLGEALNTFEKLKSSTQDPLWSIIADLKSFEITQIQ